MVNKAILIGNITKDCDFVQKDNITVASTSIATNKRWKDKDWNKQEKAIFHNICIFGKGGEIFNKYVKKWMRIMVEWEIDNYSYEKDGEKKYSSRIIVKEFEFLSSWKEKEETNTWEDKKKTKKTDGEEDINIEEIPF